MKKGQATTAIIVLLVIIAIVMIYIAINFSSKPNLTGQVISEKTNEIVCNSPYIRVGNNCCLDKNINNVCDDDESVNQIDGIYKSGVAIVTSPFYINAWRITNYGIDLELINNGEEYYLIESIQISNCGFKEINKFLSIGEKEVFNLPCFLISGKNFKGDIIIKYKKEGSIIELISMGTIAEKVE